jgi:tRNA-Thr(GGU) m(6)t(6)A37 methyltransferase TsaA
MATHTNAGKSTQFRPIGVIRSALKSRGKAPKQGAEGAPDAWLEVRSFAAQALDGLRAGDHIIVLTWFHRARRDVLRVHPRSDPRRQLTGVFATRSPDRPNPVGLHHVTVRKVGQKSPAHRPHRSHRRYARHRHQAGASRPPRLLVAHFARYTSLVNRRNPPVPPTLI